MALIPVINNHTGDEGEVDETWLERWPEDFTPLDPEVAAHIAELLAAGAAQALEEDPASESPATEEPPSDGTTKEIN
jgi:hypothetical protein